MPYTDRTELENRFGSDNIRGWADLNNTGNNEDIVSRITWALSQADDDINEALSDGPYTVPFTTVPNTIKNIATVIASYHLYEGRGITDADPNKNQLKPAYDRVMKKLRMIQANQIKLSDPLVALYPQVVLDEASD